jgi:hypothetical protein
MLKYIRIDPTNMVEPGYNDIGLYVSPSITTGILWYHLIPHCQP